MKFLTLKKILFCFFFLSMIGFDLSAQNSNNLVTSDSKLEKLLNEKRKLNASMPRIDSYKIQIYSGSGENAKKILQEFKLEFPDTDAIMVFNSPNYKVWIGNYRTRIESEKNIVLFQNKYRNLLLIKPNK